MLNGKRHRKDAWLVTWEHTREDEAPPNRCAAIFASCWASEKVAARLEFMYALQHQTAIERFMGFGGHERPQFPAIYATRQGVEWRGSMTCGGDVFLFARHVKNLKVVRNKKGRTSVTWDELPRSMSPRAG